MKKWFWEKHWKKEYSFYCFETSFQQKTCFQKLVKLFRNFFSTKNLFSKTCFRLFRCVIKFHETCFKYVRANRCFLKSVFLFRLCTHHTTLCIDSGPTIQLMCTHMFEGLGRAEIACWRTLHCSRAPPYISNACLAYAPAYALASRSRLN